MPEPYSIESLSGNPLSEGWSDSVSSCPDAVDFLSADAIRRLASWTELTEEAVADCVETASVISSSEELALLAWHAHRLMYLTDTGLPDINAWPDDIPGLGLHTGTFYLLLALSGIDSMRSLHGRHNIPESITRLNCRDIHIWAREYKTLGEPLDDGFAHTFDPPRWGLHRRGLRWTAGSLVGRILRLGRLQFIHAPYRSPFCAFRNKETGKVQVVAEAGQRFTEAGWKTKDDEPEGWSSAYDSSDGRLTATPISPTGRAIRETIELDLKEWSPILSPGDPIIEVHIPEDGPMDFAECGESIAELIRDFRIYYPEKPYKAIVCGSWLLDPQYQDGMPTTSNICRFQRECYLYPIGPGGGRSGFFRLFTHNDLATLPRDTVMRRTYLDLLEAGGLWRGGGMMLFPEDLDWGKEVYLRMHGLT